MCCSLLTFLVSLFQSASQMFVGLTPPQGDPFRGRSLSRRGGSRVDVGGGPLWPPVVADEGRISTLPHGPYKYRFFNRGRGHVPVYGVFVFFDVPFPFAFSSCSELKVWAVSGVL